MSIAILEKRDQVFARQPQQLLRRLEQRGELRRSIASTGSNHSKYVRVRSSMPERGWRSIDSMPALHSLCGSGCPADAKAARASPRAPGRRRCAAPSGRPRCRTARSALPACRRSDRTAAGRPRAVSAFPGALLRDPRDAVRDAPGRTRATWSAAFPTRPTHTSCRRSAAQRCLVRRSQLQAEGRGSRGARRALRPRREGARGALSPACSMCSWSCSGCSAWSR